MLLVPYYCLFMFTCFHTKSGSIRDSQNIEIQCPKGCECYTAPTESLSMNMNNFSMVCTAIPSNEVYSNPIYMNTIVYRNTSGKSYENFVAASVVMVSVNDTYSLTNNKPVKYVTVYQQKYVEISYPNAVGIHIEKCQFRYNSFQYNSTSPYSRLRSLTIKSSQLEMINSDNFFPNSPLVTIDLSDNWLVNIESLCGDYHDEVLYLYLNGNRLIELPDDLSLKFPKLRVLHIQDNRIKNIINSRIERFAIGLEEFILFDHIPNDTRASSAIYNYNLKYSIIKPIFAEEANFTAVGLYDSFINGVEYICRNGQKVNWNSLKNDDICPKFDDFNDPEQFHASIVDSGYTFYQQSFNITGRAQILDRAELYNTIDWNDSFNTLVITRQQWPFMVARNILMKAQSMERHAILDLHEDIEQLSLSDDNQTQASETKNNDYIGWLIALMKKRDIIAFEIVHINSSFANFHPKYGNVCPLNSTDAKNLYRDKIRKYEWFWTNLNNRLKYYQNHQYVGPFATMMIDIKAIDLLHLFMSKELMKACFNVSPLINSAFNIVNIEPNSKFFERQLSDLDNALSLQRQMRSRDNEFVFKNLFLQVNLDPNNPVLDETKRKKLHQISTNIIKSLRPAAG